MELGNLLNLKFIRRKVLVTHENSNIEITGELLQCLRPCAWLNDEVINVYLELLKEREDREPKKLMKRHFSTLLQKGGMTKKDLIESLGTIAKYGTMTYYENEPNVDPSVYGT